MSSNNAIPREPSPLGMMVHAWNPCTQKGEVSGAGVQG